MSRLRPRVRRGARQGLRRDRHREGLEPVRRRQRRLRPRARRAARRGPRRPRRWSATSTGSSCTTSAPPTGCSAPPPGSRRSRAASTRSARSSSRTRSASAPSSRPRWPGTSTSYDDEWKATLDDPEKLAPVRLVRQRPGHARPEHLLRDRARPDQAGRQPTDPSSSAARSRSVRRDARRRRPDRGGPRRTGSRSAGWPSSRSSAERRRSCTARRSRSSAPTTTRSTRSATTTRSRKASVLARGIVGTRGDVPFVASPMHKHAFDLRTGQCLDDEHVSVPVYDGAIVEGVVLVGHRRPAAAVTLAGLPDRGHGSSQGRGADRRCSSGAAPLSSGARRCRSTRTGSTRTPCSPPPKAVLAEPGRHLPRDHRRRDAGLVRGGRVAGGCCANLLGALWRAPRSWRAGRSASARCAGRGLRERWAPESECFDDVLADLRAAT